jgi:multiple sugar transport system permease protein
MLIFLAALTAVPKDLHEAAAIDGAGSFRRFQYVSLPAIRSALAVVTILLVIGGFNVFISVLLMTGGENDTQVPLTYMYDEAFKYYDFGYGSAISFSLTALVLVISAGQYWWTRRQERLR